MKTVNSSTVIPDEPVKRKGIGLKAGVLLMVIVVMVVAGLYLGLTYVSATPTIKPVQINGYFIDVNGDGNLDYVVSSDVILNTGQLNLTPSP
jgi:hypothetical protein